MMITHIRIRNYRSILDTELEFSPFTLLVGASGAGKTNLLQILKDVSSLYHMKSGGPADIHFTRHINKPFGKQRVKITNHEGYYFSSSTTNPYFGDESMPELGFVSIFRLDPEKAGAPEELTTDPFIHEDGSGLVQVLDYLKTGDSEDLFARIESVFSRLIPDIEKLSFIPGRSVKQLQVRTKYLSKPIPVSLLSDGIRLTLTIISILNQENPPSIICFDNIDRHLHPRLTGELFRLFAETVAGRRDSQIIATTRSPGLIRYLDGQNASLIRVKMENGATTFENLSDALKDGSAESHFSDLQ